MQTMDRRSEKNSLLFAMSARGALLRKHASDTSSAACRAAQLLLRSAVPGVGAGAGQEGGRAHGGGSWRTPWRGMRDRGPARAAGMRSWRRARAS